MKDTPSYCKLDECPFNAIAPPENSQECSGCFERKDPQPEPKPKKREKPTVSERATVEE